MILQASFRDAKGVVGVFQIEKTVLEEGIEGGIDDRTAIETARALVIGQVEEETGKSPAMVLVAIQGGKK